ncbi:multifunctional CCA tRNA nucleotidyl transferase/2'3'-cyclic phosphodiesterase/2'nucleotidase/phosphatase [Aliidiomarina iranensis]|uniref:Multifunctional CCA tRNA nucleotidyl transferase/2'3'-cyclic phosphodiesterase/2'nucleotidase/phosphatase n=1 Tax=Aliidiomarina iranensis TaxID=1434071 RepID=A0A432VU39_9GAMM|nr:multifunctional CCA tRNA nucleotidyl transferase/2'3'-cyclic phosphodiesterase/2'nucleotidase/phosphatase [Aliidiomarina iranensis]RUO19995.1 multifunctional CCA tRNA nucleotidyl transferase/2'3'-cyclic phosphodiesterase/2'nucleotidase/phosphatase [Aliidiomarina iranensis]
MKVYVVGGAVRDELLGLPVADYDYVVVGATPEELLAAGYTPVGNDFPVFLHPQTQAEYALARTERKSGSGYTGFICYSAPDVTLEDDLLRRDLTINAIAKDSDGKLYDPYGGVADIQNRKLRHVSNAFQEDPLRVLRVARFYARFFELGFTIANETFQLMAEMVSSGELAALTAERVWQETHKAFLTPNPEVFFATLAEIGALAALLGVRKPQSGSHLTTNSLSNTTQSISAQFPQLIKLSGGNFAREAIKDKAKRETLVLQRYVLLCVDLHQQFLAHLNVATAFKVPHKLQRAAEETERVLRELTRGELNAEQILLVFQRNDSWRRPEQFHVVLDSLQIILADSEIAKRRDFLVLTRGLAVLSAIDVQKIVAAGFKNQEISEQLNLERKRAIERMLAESLNG